MYEKEYISSYRRQLKIQELVGIYNEISALFSILILITTV